MKKTATKHYSGFRGIDTSNSAMEVDNAHATVTKNFVLKNNLLSKRNGTAQVARIKDKRINGCWQLRTVENGQTQTHTIVHAEKGFYRVIFGDPSNIYYDLLVKNGAGENLSHEGKSYKVDSALIRDERSFGTELNGKLYIACGDLLVYGEYDGVYELRRVYENTDTYIPTTTISIDCKSNTTDTNVEALDDVNLFTRWRKNTLVGDVAGSQYELDGTVVEGTTIKVKVGETDLAADKFSLGSDRKTLTLVDAHSSIDGEANITVEFCAEMGSNPAPSKCNIGIVYGESGNINRLFLSGNAEHKNKFFYSGHNDYTYFPLKNANEIGHETSAISFFSRTNDGGLAVFKETVSNQEPAIWHISPKSVDVYASVYNSETGAVEQVKVAEEVVFSASGGLLGVRIGSKYACGALNGDNLFLATNGVYALKTAENTVVAEKKIQLRSKPLNGALKLKKVSLSDAVATVHEDMFYLSVGGECYVADCNYLFDNANYEWWVLENIDARVFFELDGELAFGKDDGRIIVMNQPTFVDKTIEEEALAAVNVTDHTLTVAQGVCKNGESFRLVSESDLYARIDVVKQDGNYYTNDKIVEKWTLYDHLYRPYTIHDLKLVLVDGKNGYSFNVGGLPDVNYFYRKINNELLTVKEAKDVSYGGSTATTFKATQYGDTLKITNVSTASHLEVVREKAVEAVWYTNISDLSAPNIAKTLTDIFITPESTSDGQISFGFNTYTTNGAYSVAGTSLFSFLDLDFNNFTFNSQEFPRGYHRYLMERDKNFVQFVIKSQDKRNASVNRFSVRYILNREIRGEE